MPIVPDAFDNWDMIDRQNGIDPSQTGYSPTQLASLGMNPKDDLYYRAMHGDTAAYEKWMNFYLSELSNSTTRDWLERMRSTQYQTLVEDLKKAGISPYVISGANPMAMSSSGNSYTGSQMTSQQSNRLTTKTSTNNAILNDFFKILGTVLGAVAMAAMA